MFGQMDLTKRKSELEKFVSGQVPFMIVTDLCARGIDIPDVEVVINYDFPADLKTFIHRCGRTARVDREGRAYSLITREEMHFMVEMERVLYSRTLKNDDERASATEIVEEKAEEHEVQKLAKGRFGFGIEEDRKTDIKGGGIVVVIGWTRELACFC